MCSLTSKAIAPRRLSLLASLIAYSIWTCASSMVQRSPAFSATRRSITESFSSIDDSVILIDSFSCIKQCEAFRMTVVDDYKSGMKMNAIAKKHSVTKTCIYDRLRKAGVSRTRTSSKYKNATGKTKVELIRGYVFEHLSSHPCVDCGEDNVLTLQFDHRSRETKSFAIATALIRPHDYSIIRICNEMKKCDVRCANCHQIKTSYQFNNWRLKHL